MAKSTRSKIKRAYRAKKRETGVYAAAEAARLQRLNTKLSRVVASGKEDNMPLEGSGKDDDIMAAHAFIDNDAFRKISSNPLPSFAWAQCLIRYCSEDYIVDNPLSDGGSIEEQKQPESIQPDAEQRPRISTHGPRNSRREEWRKSKGIPPRSRKDFRRGSIARGQSRKRGCI